MQSAGEKRARQGTIMRNKTVIRIVALITVIALVVTTVVFAGVALFW